jgi:hypothetical protein
MYTINFAPAEDTQVQSTSKILECINFGQTLYQCPSDRHMYAMKFIKSPVSVGRLPQTAKELLKFVRYGNL